MKTRLLFVVLLLTLTGCAVQRAAFAQKAATAADAELEVATWASCETPTIGALMRKYTKEEIGQYLDRCAWLRR